MELTSQFGVLFLKFIEANPASSEDWSFDKINVILQVASIVSDIKDKERPTNQIS
jgi:hypothetical protein